MMRAGRVRLVLGAFKTEGFYATVLCKVGCVGLQTQHAEEKWIQGGEDSRGWIVVLLEVWNRGPGWKLLGGFREMFLVLGLSCWESCGSSPAGGCTCKCTRGDMHSTEQPGLSRQREFTEYSFEKSFHNNRERQKRPEQSWELSDWDFREVLQLAV